MLDFERHLADRITTKARTADSEFFTSQFDPSDLLDGPKGSIDRTITLLDSLGVILAVNGKCQLDGWGLARSTC